MIYKSHFSIWISTLVLLWVSPLHGVERSCLIIATSILSPGTISPEVKEDELVQSIVAAAHAQNQLGSDATSLLAEAARHDIKRRAEMLGTMIRNRPGDRELRSFNTAIVGGGPTGAVLAANLDGTRTVVFNNDEFMGTFSRFGDMFYINSQEVPGKPSPNVLPISDRASVQVGAIATASTPPGRVIGNATEMNLAMSQADFLLNTTVTKARWLAAQQRFEITTIHGEKYYSDVVVAGTGLGARKFPFRDENTLKLIGSEYASGRPRIRFIDDFMTEDNALARRGTNPIHRYSRKRVVIIGKGDGGSISAESVLGLGPPAGYAYRTSENTATALPASVLWLGPEWKNAEEFKKSVWDRYWDLAPFIDNKKLIPRAGHAARIERRNDGTFKVIYGEGPADFTVADEIIVSAGYDTSVAPEIFSDLAPDGDSTKLVTQMVKSSDGRANLARQVVYNGVPIPAFIAGPATGGLETIGEPGGDRSPRIQVMGWRNAQLSQIIRGMIRQPRRCATCQVSVPVVVNTGWSATHRFLPLNPGFGSIRVASEAERELRIQFRLISILDRLYPAGLSRKISFRILRGRGGWMISSKELDIASLAAIKTMIDADEDLLTLIRTQPSLKHKSVINVNFEPANPLSMIHSVAFTSATNFTE